MNIQTRPQSCKFYWGFDDFVVNSNLSHDVAISFQHLAEDTHTHTHTQPSSDSSGGSLKTWFPRRWSQGARYQRWALKKKKSDED